MSDLSKKRRDWRWTLNNYTEEDLAHLPTVECRYVVYGKEIAPTTGTPHLQGYIYFDNPRVGRSVKKLISDRACMLTCEKSSELNIAYCKKDGDFTERGERPEQGKRTDLDEAAEEIRSGRQTVDQLTWESPRIFHQYGRTLDRLEAIRETRIPVRNFPTQGVWIYGPGGVGKSKWVWDFGVEAVYSHTYEDSGWWDLYKGQKIVLFDEFRGQIKFDMMLKLADRYPFYVSRRGKAPMPFTSSMVVVTSDRDPSEAFKEEKSSMWQLYRRFMIFRMDASDEVYHERYFHDGTFIGADRVDDFDKIFS